MIKVHRNYEAGSIVYQSIILNDVDVIKINGIGLEEILNKQGITYYIIKHNEDIICVSELDDDEEQIWYSKKENKWFFEESFGTIKNITSLPYDYYTLDIIRVCTDKVYKLCQGETLFLYNNELVYPEVQKGGPKLPINEEQKPETPKARPNISFFNPYNSTVTLTVKKNGVVVDTGTVSPKDKDADFAFTPGNVTIEFSAEGYAGSSNSYTLYDNSNLSDDDPIMSTSDIIDLGDLVEAESGYDVTLSRNNDQGRTTFYIDKEGMLTRAVKMARNVSTAKIKLPAGTYSYTTDDGMNIDYNKTTGTFTVSGNMTVNISMNTGATGVGPGLPSFD